MPLGGNRSAAIRQGVCGMQSRRQMEFRCSRRFACYSTLGDFTGGDNAPSILTQRSVMNTRRKYHSLHVCGFQRTKESFAVSVQVRTPTWQANRHNVSEQIPE